MQNHRKNETFSKMWWPARKNDPDLTRPKRTFYIVLWSLPSFQSEQRNFSEFSGTDSLSIKYLSSLIHTTPNSIMLETQYLSAHQKIHLFLENWVLHQILLQMVMNGTIRFPLLIPYLSYLNSGDSIVFQIPSGTLLFELPQFILWKTPLFWLNIWTLNT